MITLLDGAMGTELAARGVAMPAPIWSAAALVEAPEIVRAVHAEYAAAGADVHTANTFRTKRRSAGDRWDALARRAVELARAAAAPSQRVAGSLAPLEDCYRPDQSPPNPRPEHRELAQCLAHAGVDLLLCETFPHVGEALVAIEEAVATGIETWVAFTAGPDANLLTPNEVEFGGREAVRRGAKAVLVNCTPARRTLEYVERLQDLGVPFGAYANAGTSEEQLGWEAPDPTAAVRYAALAAEWIRHGATIVGGCCGTRPAHIRALNRLLAGTSTG